MKLREREYHTCKTCKQRTKVKREEAFGCDTCRKVIDLSAPSQSGKHHGYLRASVFYAQGETKHLHYCSWACALRGLAEEPTDYFIDLPYLTYDGRDPGISAADFWKAVRAFK